MNKQTIGEENKMKNNQFLKTALAFAKSPNFSAAPRRKVYRWQTF